MKKKKDKVMERMISSAMPEQKTMLRLHGKHAQQFHGMKPGSPVSAEIQGKLHSVGMGSEYGPPGQKGEHEAMIQVHSTRMKGKGKNA